MSTEEIESNLATLLQNIIQHEKKVEVARIQLAKNSNFNALQIFRKMDQDSKNYITEFDFSAFLRRTNSECDESNLRQLFHIPSSRGGRLTYNDFLSIVLPQSDFELKDLCIKRTISDDIDTQQEKESAVSEVDQLVADVFKREFEFQNQFNKSRDALVNIPNINLSTVFRLMDPLNRGVANYESVTPLMKKVQSTFSESDFKVLARRIDPIQSGNITLLDFRNLMSVTQRGLLLRNVYDFSNLPKPQQSNKSDTNVAREPTSNIPVYQRKTSGDDTKMTQQPKSALKIYKVKASLLEEPKTNILESFLRPPNEEDQPQQNSSWRYQQQQSPQKNPTSLSGSKKIAAELKSANVYDNPTVREEAYFDTKRNFIYNPQETQQQKPLIHPSFDNTENPSYYHHNYKSDSHDNQNDRNPARQSNQNAPLNDHETAVFDNKRSPKYHYTEKNHDSKDELSKYQYHPPPTLQNDVVAASTTSDDYLDYLSSPNRGELESRQNRLRDYPITSNRIRESGVFENQRPLNLEDLKPNAVNRTPAKASFAESTTPLTQGRGIFSRFQPNINSAQKEDHISQGETIPAKTSQLVAPKYDFGEYAKYVTNKPLSTSGLIKPFNNFDQKTTQALHLLGDTNEKGSFYLEKDRSAFSFRGLKYSPSTVTVEPNFYSQNPFKENDRLSSRFPVTGGNQATNNLDNPRQQPLSYRLTNLFSWQNPFNDKLNNATADYSMNKKPTPSYSFYNPSTLPGDPLNPLNTPPLNFETNKKSTFYEPPKSFYAQTAITKPLSSAFPTTNSKQQLNQPQQQISNASNNTNLNNNLEPLEEFDKPVFSKNEIQNQPPFQTSYFAGSNMTLPQLSSAISNLTTPNRIYPQDGSSNRKINHTSNAHWASPFIPKNYGQNTRNDSVISPPLSSYSRESQPGNTLSQQLYPPFANSEVKQYSPPERPHQMDRPERDLADQALSSLAQNQTGGLQQQQIPSSIFGPQSSRNNNGAIPLSRKAAGSANEAGISRLREKYKHLLLPESGSQIPATIMQEAQKNSVPEIKQTKANTMVQEYTIPEQQGFTAIWNNNLDDNDDGRSNRFDESYVIDT